MQSQQNTPYCFVSAGDGTDNYNIYAKNCIISKIIVTNRTATPCCLKIFDKTTAAVLGTDTPKLNIDGLATGGFECSPSAYLANGLTWALTANAALLDTANPVAGVSVNIEYEKLIPY